MSQCDLLPSWLPIKHFLLFWAVVVSSISWRAGAWSFYVILQASTAALVALTLAIFCDISSTFQTHITCCQAKVCAAAAAICGFWISCPYVPTFFKQKSLTMWWGVLGWSVCVVKGKTTQTQRQTFSWQHLTGHINVIILYAVTVHCDKHDDIHDVAIKFAAISSIYSTWFAGRYNTNIYFGDCTEFHVMD